MNISTLGRCIDQPLVLNKLHKKMPALLISSGIGFGVYDTIKSSKNCDVKNKKTNFIKNAIIITSTISASLIGARGLNIKPFSVNILGKKYSFASKRIVPALLNNPSVKEILLKQNKAIDEFLNNSNVVNSSILNILNKARKKPLSLKETNILVRDIPDSLAKENLFKTLFPKPENLSAKEIFSEIGRLSLLGAIPVIGGIAGGIVADRVTDTQSSKSISNKIKEGFYQYFANIFLCNVGACAALFTAERLQAAKIIKPLSSMQRLAVILSGITLTGIIGGSYIANKLSQKIIDPIFNKGEKVVHKNLYDERKPELLDIALHTDDIATAGVLSGFKWIEPALPFMYFLSGYRAGIGYRNNKCEKLK